MSAFLLIIETAPGSDQPGPVLRDDYTMIEAPFGHLFLFGPSAGVVHRSPRHLLAHHGEWLSPNEIGRLKQLDPVPSASWKEQRGTVIRIDGPSRAAHIATDLVGSFPVFYALNAQGTRFVAGSHFAEVRLQAGAEIDAVGCYEFMTGAFCVGSRTLAKGVRQLTAQESMTITVADIKLRSVRQVHSVLWAPARDEGRKQTHEALTDIWLQETAVLDKTELMMSAGWDSRALLAGIAANGHQGSIVAYSHGDVDGRELRLAGRMCEDVGARHVSAPLAQDLFDPGAAERVLSDADTYIFPYWWRAAAIGRTDLGATKFTGGLYGAVLGGHNNVPDRGSSSARLRALARYLAGGSHRANGVRESELAAASLLVRPAHYHRLWCFTDEFHHEHGPGMLRAVRADTDAVLTSYQSRGIETVEKLLEAFEVDHKLRQYMNGQLLSGTSQLRARNPFTNPDLLRIGTSLPLSSKVHNILHRAIIKRIAPQLLRYPMAATLVPASAPISIQEITRVQRVLLEQVAAHASRLSRGLTPTPRFGWPAFQFLKGHQGIHDIVDSLKLDIWDRARMHRVIRETPGNLHPLFDMIGKFKTADYRLTAQR